MSNYGQSQGNDHLVALIESQLQVLDADESFVDQDAIRTLRTIGQQAVPYLISLLRNQDRWSVAAWALIHIGSPTIDLLIPYLGDPDIDIFVSDILARIGSDAIPSLILELRHPDPNVRTWAALILGWIGERHVLSALQNIVNDPDETVRRATLESIARLQRLP